MARIRSRKPEFFTDEDLAAVSVNAERTYAGMSTIADDRGRVRDQPAVVNGMLWPLRPWHTAENLETELGELEREGLVCRYMGCDGKRYLHLVPWDDDQKIDRPSKTRLPRCPRHAYDEDCGRHDGECSAPPAGSVHERTSTSPREPSRVLDAGTEARNGQQLDIASIARPVGGDDAQALAAANHAQACDQQEHQSSREPREPSMQDLGPRTLDLGITTNTSSTSTPSTSSVGSGSKPRRTKPTANPAFDEFYSIYPRKVAKPDARKAWDKAIKNGASPTAVIAGAARYRDDPDRRRREPQYTAHPATWLNGERWLDPPTERASPAETHAKPANYFRSANTTNPFDEIDGDAA